MPITTTPSGTQGEFSTYTPIYAQTISSNTSSITLSNIPTTFTDLVLKISVISTSTSLNYIHLQYNGDTGSNYSTTVITGTGSAAESQRWTNRTNFNIDYYATPHTEIGTRSVQIMNYSNTTTFKSGLSRSDRAGGGTDATMGLWRSTAPITSITITHDTAQFAVGSTITLYGIKAAAPAPKATGGDVITTDGTYWYHAFKNSGVFDVKQSLTADLLVVAGGGGGGSRWGGGGGAGGLRCLASQSLTPIQYSVTIGGGGGGGASSSYISGNSGTNSSFSTTSTTGGGGGGSNAAGLSGGSGGGGGTGGSSNTRAGGSGNAGSYSPVEGFAGGTTPALAYQGAGGGGAGAAGSTAPAQQRGGAGGAGANSYNSITFTSWLTATSTGVSGYLAGGGGGGGETANGGISGGAGGSGGGGRGGNQNEASGVAATVNTGGGGGGGANDVSAGAAGGSGIVIVRYAV